MTDGRLPDNEQHITNNMTIDHHNYEEYFILYMDNELGSDERRMVDAFIEKNPDLKEELEILMQYKMVPDDSIVFEGKEELIKIGGDVPVSISNFDEWMVLYMDNELTAEQKNKIDQFIIANPLAQKEAELMLQTKLQPETIVFVNKEVLYRKEEKDKPVIWWRVAAAVLILLIGATTFVLMNKKGSTTKPGIAKAPSVEQKLNKENPVATNTDDQNTPQVKEDEVKQTPSTVIDNNTIVREEVAVNSKAVDKNSIPKKEVNKQLKFNSNIPAPVQQKEEVLATNNNKPSNNLPQPDKNNSVINDINTTNAVAKNDAQKKIANDNTSLTNPKVTNAAPVTSDIVNASFASNDDTQLEQPGKKGKLRGFFRKVTRTFEKRTNIDPTENDEKLLLGGLAINLK